MSVRRAPKDQEGSLIQRCVIVQKDENGYGLTVSGDNPVYVQSVRENGSAAKAGVQVGDRIIKVNGILVTKSNHIEVVKLIKSGSYVALTLLGRPPGERISSGSPSPNSERAFSYNRTLNQSTSPTQKEPPDSQQQERLVALQRMLDQEHLYYTKTLDGYKLSPSSKLQKDLADSQTRIKAIENQIRIISSNHTTNKLQLVSQSSRSVFKPIIDNRPASPKVTGHIRSKSAYAIRSQSSSSIPHAASFSADYPSSEFDAFPRSVSLDYTAEEEETGEERSKEEGGSLEDGARSSEDRRGGDREGDISSTDCRQAVDETEQGITMSAPARSLAQHLVESMHGKPPDGDECPLIIEVHDQAMESEPLSRKRDFNDTDASPTTTSPTKLPQMNIFPVEDINQNQDGIFQGGKIEHLQPLHPATSVISMEDEEFELDNEKIDDHGPFVDLNCLKNKPAHLAIFLHFLMSNSDPSALFFWLVTEIYAAEQGSVKDFKKWAYEIYSVFLSINAPLKVSISENADQAIDEALSNKNSTEEGLRNIFKTARLFAFNEVSEQLADFRNKRALGLGSLFGDNQLEDDLDKSKELKVVEDTLLPHIEALVFETESGNNGSAQQDRNSAMASSLATFMKHVRNNVKPGSSQASPLDKCRSFVEKERISLFKLPRSKKIFNIKGHQFVPMQYTSITQCHYCGETLWGIGHQGYQCSACEYNVHKGTCSDSVDEVCPGSKRKYKERNKAKRIPPKDFKQRLPVKDYSTDEVIIDSRADSQSLPVETRSRDNSINEDTLKSSSVSGKDSVLSGEESTLSETETERPESVRQGSSSINEEVPTQPLPQSTSLRFRPVDSWRRKELYGGAVDRSISLRSPRELVKIQEKKRSIPPLPGLPAKSGLTGDNGVYSAYPFPGPKGSSESPPLSEDEEEWDPDLDVEEETPIWSQVVDKKTVKGLKNKELKRQEVIHELIHTEKTHVRKLLVLEKVFYKPMMRKNVLPPESLHQLFPNLEDLISVHTSLLAAMKARSAENEVVQIIGDIMLARFDGAAGDVVKEAAARFCNYQKIALEALKNRQKKDPKVNSFMVQQELNPLCRRLKFPDIIASTHQRFTKYPLLLEGIAKATLQNHGDRKDVEKCVECCKAILNHINQTIKDTENTARLIELSKKIEVKQIESSNQNMKKEIAELDITSHKLIYEGDLIWRITRNKSIELHALLLNDVLVLLQKQDEKYILKCHSTTAAGGNLEAKKITHSPVIKLSNLLARNVATDKKAFFIVSTSSLGPQIYEMVTASTTERRTWFKVISDSVELAKGKVLERGRRGGLSLGSTPTIPEANGKEEGRDKQKSTEKDSDEEEDEENIQSDTSLTKSDSNKLKSPVDFEKLTNEAVVDDHCEPGGEGRFHSEGSHKTPSRFRRKAEPPSKERMAYLYEQLKQKDEELKRVMEEKEKIVAELRGEDAPPFTTQEPGQDCELEPKELVLAAILQANRLTLAVNDMCNLHRSLMADQSESRDGSISTSPPPVSHLEDRDNEEELHRQDILLEVTATLNEQLTTILGLVAERDNTRERLHSELQSAKATIQRMSHAGLVHSISHPNDGDDHTHSVSEAPPDYGELYSPEFKKQVSLPTSETGDSLFGPRRGSSPHFLPEDSTVVSGLNTDANQEDSILLVNHLDDTLESYDV